MFIKIKSNQLHAVSRTQQGRQRKPSVKTVHSLKYLVIKIYFINIKKSLFTTNKPCPANNIIYVYKIRCRLV